VSDARAAVATGEELLKNRQVSERSACQDWGSPSAAWWPAPEAHPDALMVLFQPLAERYPLYGCPTLHDRLRKARHVVNHKLKYRLYTEEVMKVRTRQ
jgi:putative transposase